MNLGYMNLNVKLVGLGCGVGMGELGHSHYGWEDIALLRSIPNMTIICPSDCGMIKKSLYAVALRQSPTYIRLTNTLNVPIVYEEDFDFEIGKAIRLKSGDDVALIATGSMVHTSLKAAEILEQNGISCSVIDFDFEIGKAIRLKSGDDVALIATGSMVHTSLKAAEILEQNGISCSVIDLHTIKPLDEEAVLNACKSHKLIATIEEHSIIGGLGGAIAEFKARIGCDTRQIIIGLPDSYGHTADYSYQLEKEEHSIIGGLGGAIAEFKARIGCDTRQIIIGLPDSYGHTADYSYQLEKYGLCATQIAQTIQSHFN